MTWEEDYKAATIKEFEREVIIERDKTIVTGLILIYNFSNAEISDFTNVPIRVIKNIRQKLKHLKFVPKTHEEIIYHRKQ